MKKCMTKTIATLANYVGGDGIAAEWWFSIVSYSQICSVAKVAEVFGDCRTPIVMRELCFGPGRSVCYARLALRLFPPL